MAVVNTHTSWGSIPPFLCGDSLIQLSVSLNFRGHAGPMTNRGAFIGAGTKIYWFKQFYGFLIVSDICVPRCVILPLFHISWLYSPRIYDAHSLPIMKIEDVI